MTLESRHPSDPFAASLIAYLRTTLHTEMSLRAWPGSQQLPVFLANRYRFYQGHIADRPCLFMALEDTSDLTPLDIAKHVGRVRSAFEGLVVLAVRHLSSTMRARLIAQRVAFAVPGNQLYIPQLAMDLRDHFRTPEPVRGDHLSPAAQAVLFDHLLRRTVEPATPSMLAEHLHYSAMSVGRAFDELASRSLAKVERRGREKVLEFTVPPRSLIEKSARLLRTPVRGRHGVRFTRGSPPFQYAGEAALAKLTDLNPPRLPTFAIYAVDWMFQFTRNGLVETNDINEAEALIETWRYDPRGLSRGETADPLSLYAAYRNHKDERVAQAANQLLERIEW